MAAGPIEGERFYTGKELIRVQPGEAIRLRPDFSKVIRHDAENEIISQHGLYVVGIGRGRLLVQRNTEIVTQWDVSHDVPGKRHDDTDAILPAGNIPLSGEITERGFVPDVRSLPAEMRIYFPRLTVGTLLSMNPRLVYADQVYTADTFENSNLRPGGTAGELYVMDWRGTSDRIGKLIYLPQSQDAFDNVAIYIDRR